MSEEWSDLGRVAEYLSREIPHRRIGEEMLLQALPAHVERFIDLGTGDGRLLALVRDRHPEAVAIGLDSSQPMLNRARERFNNDLVVELREHDLRDLLKSEPSLLRCRDWQFITSRTAVSESCSQRYTACLTQVGYSRTSTSYVRRLPACTSVFAVRSAESRTIPPTGSPSFPSKWLG